MTAFCQLWLTCADKAEADTIASALLDQKLIVCAKQVPITADFTWQGKIERSQEVLLVMESKLAYFEAIETLVAEHHSYETFVLQAIPLAKVSSAATQWIEENLDYE